MSVMVQLKEKKNAAPQKDALLEPEMGPVSVSVMALVKEKSSAAPQKGALL